MNKIEKMIKELCPNGVEWKSIGSLIKRYNKKAKNITDIKVYSISNTKGLISADEYREHIIHSKDTSNYSIINKGMFAYNPARLNIGSIAYLKDNQALVSPMYVVFEIDTTMITQQFLLYLIQSPLVLNKIISLTESGARFRFDFDRWNSIFIPVPPLEIQDEIVNILDTFTKLQVNLTAELQARKKQYEYYRDKLLSFDNILKRGGEVKKLNEVLKYEQPTKYIVKNTDYLDRGIPVLTAGKSFILGYTDEDNCYNATKETPVILFDDFTTTSKWIDFKFKVKSSAVKLLTLVDSDKYIFKYVYYAMQSIHYLTLEHSRQWIEKYSNIIIPIPPLEVQVEIVNILDKFEQMCNSLTEGLPSEIAARKKQYEYYRDRLLCFDYQ